MPENVEIMCKFVSYNTFTEVSQSETTAFEAFRPRVGRERSAKAQWSFAASRFPGKGFRKRVAYIMRVGLCSH